MLYVLYGVSYINKQKVVLVHTRKAWRVM